MTKKTNLLTFERRPLSALQTDIREPTQNLAFMRQEITVVKQELAHLSMGENLLWRDLDKDQEVL